MITNIRLSDGTIFRCREDQLGITPWEAEAYNESKMSSREEKLLDQRSVYLATRLARCEPHGYA